jgi:hypothetical protein
MLDSVGSEPPLPKMKRAGPLWTGFFIFAIAKSGFGSAWEAGSPAAAPTRERRQKRQEQPEREARRAKSCPRNQETESPAECRAFLWPLM